jgi:hypothetical protein
LSGNADFTAVFEVLGTLAENPSLSAIINGFEKAPKNKDFLHDRVARCSPGV